MALTYYEVLGVPENATNAEIEAAFKSKAREVHPDKVGSGSPYLQKVAAEAFKELSEARSVLLDRAKRQKYDSALAYMRGSAASSSTSSAPQPPPPPPPNSTSSRTAPTQSGSPPPQPQQFQKQSFWKPINTAYGTVALLLGGVGLLLCLQGLAGTEPLLSLGLALVFTSLGLLSWRHGMRPGTDPKVLGGSVFLFIFAAAFVVGWFQSSPTTPTPNTKEPSKSAAPAPAAIHPSPEFIPYAPATTGVSKHLPGAKDSSPSTARPKVDRLSPSGKGESRTEKAELSNGPPAVSSDTLVPSRTVPSGSDGESTYPVQSSSDASGDRAGTIVTPHPKPDISTLSYDEKASIEMACVMAKSEGPASYNRCLSSELARLASAPAHPDLSRLSYDEKASIEMACVMAKSEGPASYNRCLSSELARLAGAPAHPDLSRLSYDEKASIEMACVMAKSEGPASYNRCLSSELARLQAHRHTRTSLD